ncbi:DUF397 domain-containing protein [Actinocorallia sp. A-T 12471]|uniref:DUF397 domain-containing protein n=1 Tax=Actinocorallia sp. A-T 12471 TaxID=3089813 RepID=UPI0029D1C8EA|nr:DUF397 domain-containing protein [Actinocorallia sp. A-T 12471]MDX6742486.1 DUF397 domain-containing protein [Actinocorallia sp. A-T 12471]
MSDNSRVAWRKSSYSAQNGACVEVGKAARSTAVGVRDSKNPQAPALAFARPAFGALVSAVKAAR